MFGLLCGLWQLMFSRHEYNVLILGLDDAGKTTLLEQLRHRYSGTPSPAEMKIPPTVGLNIGRLEIGSNNRVVFWDLGGQVSLRILWDKYFSESHAILFVIDSANISRVDQSVDELRKLILDKDLCDAPILIFANKQDLGGAISANDLNIRIEESLRDSTAREALAGRHFRIEECSAIKGTGIEKGIEWLMNVLPKCKRTLQMQQNRT